MNANEKRKLGRTDVELTQFGFGAASLGEIFALVREEDTLSTLQTHSAGRVPAGGERVVSTSGESHGHRRWTLWLSDLALVGSS